MKKYLLLVLAFLLFVSRVDSQNPKYDGDWKASFSGVCADRDMDGPIREGSGQWWYRILTMEDYTTIRVKVRYPCKNDYEYWNCHVVHCDDSSLEWCATINQYDDYEDGVHIVIDYHCTIRCLKGFLVAHVYYTQKEYDKNGRLITADNYGHETINLYKETDDW